MRHRALRFFGRLAFGGVLFLSPLSAAGEDPAIDAGATQTQCEPQWVPTFGNASGMDDTIFAFTVFDDGSGAGPALYAGGRFLTAGGEQVNGVARWNGSEWSPLGSGVDGVTFQASVEALAVFDDGSGPALFVGGAFIVAGGEPAIGIAKWDGSAWSAVGGGVDNGVFALTVFDDGTGPALYAGGWFTIAGGVPAQRIARWDGVEWSPLGQGISGYVDALEVFDDGSGPALIAGGRFEAAGGAPATNIARWDGAEWSPLESGLSGDPGISTVRALAVFDDGAGPALYAGGNFFRAGDLFASNIAKWNGDAWSVVSGGNADVPGLYELFSSGGSGAVFALTVVDDGSGPALYAAGRFSRADGSIARNIARWNGAAWSTLGIGIGGVNASATSFVYALAAFDDGAGSSLYAGGRFTLADNSWTGRIARWDGEEWFPVGNGLGGGATLAFATFDDGSGPALYAGGYFTTVGGEPAKHIARWDGAHWSPLGSGMGGSIVLRAHLNALAVFDDGSGPALYAGGAFRSAGGQQIEGIAKWDGAHWSPVGSGRWNSINTMTVFDDGAGPALYAGGAFFAAPGEPVSSIAKWDGAAWSAVGDGVNAGVFALTVFDDGSGPALYAGGDFTTAGGEPASRIAKWDGSAWSGVGNGMNASVGVLTVFDDGSGPALYAGGVFDTAGGEPASRIARWDGSAWSPLGDGIVGNFGITSVEALTVYDDGAGPSLYAGGIFTTAGGAPASNIAKWDGSAWSPLSTGTGAVYALTVFNDGTGPALFVGGNFLSAGGVNDSFIAKWQGCAASTSCPGDTNADGFVNFSDLHAVLGQFGATVPSGTGADINGDGLVNFLDLNEVLANFGLACH